MCKGKISSACELPIKTTKSGIKLKFKNCGKTHVDASSICLEASDRMIPTESNLSHHPNDQSQVPGPDFLLPTKDVPVSSEVTVDKGWNTSSGYLRPRIFCLEHAIQIEEMLQSKGGANVLLICHSGEYIWALYNLGWPFLNKKRTHIKMTLMS